MSDIHARTAGTLLARLRRGEDGTIALWLLGLAVVLLFLGGISLDLWRGFAVRRDLAGVVDAAAVAGASAIDEAAFRDEGEVVLDPGRARLVACDYLQRHSGHDLSCAGIAATPQQIRVTVDRDVPLTLMRVLMAGQGPLTVEVSAVADPRASG